MVWIYNYAIPKQYRKTLVEARKDAISWLQEQPPSFPGHVVWVQAKENSKKHLGSVTCEDFGNVRRYFWIHQDKKYGPVMEQLYKNGKIVRRK